MLCLEIRDSKHFTGMLTWSINLSTTCCVACSYLSSICCWGLAWSGVWKSWPSTFKLVLLPVCPLLIFINWSGPATLQLASTLKHNHLSTFWRLIVTLMATYALEKSRTASYLFSKLMLVGLGTSISLHMALMGLAVSKKGGKGLLSHHSFLNKMDNSGCWQAPWIAVLGKDFVIRMIHSRVDFVIHLCTFTTHYDSMLMMSQ